MQVGHHQQTSTNCKSRPWFGLDKQLSTLVLKFNFIFQSAAAIGGRNTNSNLHKALLVVRHFKQTLRLTIYISTIFAATLLLGFRPLTNPVTITGHLKKNPKDSSAFVERVSIFVKGDNKVLAQTISDDKGNFTLTFTPEQEKSFDFYCSGLGIDTILIASFKSFKSDTPDILFYIPGLRKKTSLGKTICPKCNKADKVYKIVYRDRIPDHFDDDTEVHKQNANPNIINGLYYAGTCILGVSKYFCDRDKVEF